MIQVVSGQLIYLTNFYITFLLLEILVLNFDQKPSKAFNLAAIYGLQGYVDVSCLLDCINKNKKKKQK